MASGDNCFLGWHVGFSYMRQSLRGGFLTTGKRGGHLNRRAIMAVSQCWQLKNIPSIAFHLQKSWRISQKIRNFGNAFGRDNPPSERCCIDITTCSGDPPWTQLRCDRWAAWTSLGWLPQLSWASVFNWQLMWATAMFRLSWASCRRFLFFLLILLFLVTAFDK